MWWFVLALLTAVSGAITWNSRGRARWRALASELKLSFSEESYWLRWRMSGRLRGCAISVVVHQPEDRRRGLSTSISVQTDPPIDTALTLRSEDIKSRAFKLLGTDDDQLGDAAFDREICVHGPPMVLLGVLDAPTRAAVRRVIKRWGVYVEGGAIYSDRRGVLTNTHKLRQLLLDMVGLAQHLRPPVDGYQAATQRALASDPEVGVRRRCLDLLLARTGPITEAAATIAMQDADAELRRLAALAAGPAGLDTLQALLDDPQLGAAEADSIFVTLEAKAPSIAIAQIQRLLVARPRPATAVAVRAAGTLGLREALPRLNTLARHPDLAGACVDAMRRFGDPAAEPGLIAALDAPDVEVVRRAVDTLGHLGSRAAIGPLRGVQARALRKDVADAIDRIAAREAPGRGGGLSMVADARGALSPIAGQAGSLSEPATPDGQDD